MSEFLDSTDLRNLTDRARRDEQVSRLDEFGIPYKLVGRRLNVLWYHVRLYYEGKPMKQSTGPRLDLVR